MASGSSETNGGSTGTSIASSVKTKVVSICPGEKVIIKRRINILNTILENGASAGSTCDNFLINQKIEDRVIYGFLLEWQRGVSCGSTFEGISIGGTNYPFGTKIQFCDVDNGLDKAAGVDYLYNQITDAIPNGKVIFNYVRKEHTMQSWNGSTADDNVYRFMLVVSSFPTILGTDLSKVYLYGTDDPYVFPGVESDTRVRFNVYPIKLSA